MYQYFSKKTTYILLILGMSFFSFVSNVSATVCNRGFACDTTGAWVAPAGVTSVTTEVWGGGGGGYSKKINISVIPGNTYAVSIGSARTSVSGGNGANGGDSFFINTSTKHYL